MNKSHVHFEFLLGDLSATNCDERGSALLEWSRNNLGKPLVLVIFGSIDDAYSAFALVDVLGALKLRGHHLTTWGLGEMQGYCMHIFCTGQMRVVSPYTYIKVAILRMTNTPGGRSNVQAKQKLAQKLFLCQKQVLFDARRSHAPDKEDFDPVLCYTAEDLIDLGLSDVIGYVDFEDAKPRTTSDETHAGSSMGVALHLQISGEINTALAVELLKAIMIWCLEHPNAPIEAVIHSEGGNCCAALAIYDALRAASASGHFITTWIVGCAASSALTLAQAGDSRIIGPRAWSMFHEVSINSGSLGTLADMTNKQYSIEMHEKMIRKILTLRRKNDQAEQIPVELLLTQTDYWLSADETIFFGLADFVGYIPHNYDSSTPAVDSNIYIDY